MSGKSYLLQRLIAARRGKSNTVIATPTGGIRGVEPTYVIFDEAHHINDTVWTEVLKTLPKQEIQNESRS